MAKLRITIHPIFFAFGIYFALIGKVFSFIIFALTALLHEFGHYLASENYGYKLNRISLMPYGAVISGELEAIRYRDEIIIAFAGPMINFLIAIFFTALWWLVPEIYAYTDLIVMSNVAVASVNLLPCYPLDGGRILQATLSLYMSRKKASLICRWLGVALSIALLGLFVYSCFKEINLSILFFALFALCGALTRSEKNKYIRIYEDLSIRQFERGVTVENVAISENTTLKSIFKTVGTKPCNLILVDKNGKPKRKLEFDKVKSILLNGEFNETVSSVAEKISK